MRTLVESLKRLYRAGKITIEKLLDMEANRTINTDEFNYIIESEGSK